MRPGRWHAGDAACASAFALPDADGGPSVALAPAPWPSCSGGERALKTNFESENPSSWWVAALLERGFAAVRWRRARARARHGDPGCQRAGHALSHARPRNGAPHCLTPPRRRPLPRFAELYKEDGLTGGHVIMLGADDASRDAAFAALAAYPGGLQLGGGVTTDNAVQYLEAGASHVIVTSFVFREGRLEEGRLADLVRCR